MNFNDKSADPKGTAAVTHHFFASDNKESRGEASGKQFDRGGTPAWNGQPMPFNSDTGVGYVPRKDAGHRTAAAPFQGNADGMPGPAKMLWD